MAKTIVNALTIFAIAAMIVQTVNDNLQKNRMVAIVNHTMETLISAAMDAARNEEPQAPGIDDEIEI